MKKSRPPPPPPPTPSVDELPPASGAAARLMNAVQLATSASNSLPTLNPKRHSQATLLKHKSSPQVAVVQALLCSVAKVYSGSGAEAVNTEMPHVEDMFELVMNASEVALEAAAVLVDEATGVAQASRDKVEQLAKATSGAEFLGQGVRGKTLHHIEKPQSKFYDWPIDNSDSPFTPRKQTALSSSSSSSSDGEKPADPKVIQAEEHLAGLHRSNRLPSTRKRNVHLSSTRHPFESAIDEVCERQVQLAADRIATPISIQDMPCDMDDKAIPWTFVDTQPELQRMMSELENGKNDIAVDLEHHSDRSFQGFTCLIQISSREADYVVDAIALREYLPCLNKIFNDDAVTKVFHGANMDVAWLERDFGVYIVNLFDTAQAAKLLSYPMCSLSYLLERQCDVTSSMKKMFQMSDWRIRPLPTDMVKYARQDTHFLLYIYDVMREELRQIGQLGQAYRSSKNVALLRYEKDRFDPEGYMSLVGIASQGLNESQRSVLRELYRWRDATCRREDEGLQYLLNNRGMVRLAIMSSKIQTASDVLSKLSVSSISPLLRQESGRLAELITDAAQAVQKPNRKPNPTPAPSRVHTRFPDYGKPVASTKPLKTENEDDTTKVDSAVVVSASTAMKSALYSDSSSGAEELSEEEPEVELAMQRALVAGENLVRTRDPTEDAIGVGKGESETVKPSDTGNGVDAYQTKEDSDLDKDVLPLSLSDAAKKKRKAELEPRDSPKRKKAEKSKKAAETKILPHDYAKSPWKSKTNGSSRKAEGAPRPSFNPMANMNASGASDGKTQRVRHGNVKPKSGQRSFTYRS